MVSGNRCDGPYFPAINSTYTKERGGWPDTCPYCDQSYQAAMHIPLIIEGQLPVFGNAKVCLVETACRAHHYALYWHSEPTDTLRLQITLSDDE